MRSCPRTTICVGVLMASAWFPACTSSRPATSGGAAPASEPPRASVRNHGRESEASSGFREPTGWYKDEVEHGGKMCTFWWWKPTIQGVTHTVIAASLNSLPSSMPQGGGLEIPATTGDELEVEYCAMTTQGNAISTLNNGFMYVLVDQKTMHAMHAVQAKHAMNGMNAAQMRQFIPWPIIVQTPSHPGGAYAGMKNYILVTIKSKTEAIAARESFFRPNQGESIDCVDISAPANDDRSLSLQIIGPAVESGKPLPMTSDYTLFLQTVSGLDNLYDKTNNTKSIRIAVTATASPEAVFMADACAFATKAREIADAAHTPEDAPVTLCE